MELGKVLYFMSPLFGSGESIGLVSSGVYLSVTRLIMWGCGCAKNSQTSEALGINRKSVMQPWLCSVVSASLGCLWVAAAGCKSKKGTAPLGPLISPIENEGHGMASAQVSFLLGFSLPTG